MLQLHNTLPITGFTRATLTAIPHVHSVVFWQVKNGWSLVCGLATKHATQANLNSWQHISRW